MFGAVRGAMGWWVVAGKGGKIMHNYPVAPQQGTYATYARFSETLGWETEWFCKYDPAWGISLAPWGQASLREFQGSGKHTSEKLEIAALGL